MTTTVQTGRLSRPTSSYVVTASRARCLCSGGGERCTEADEEGGRSHPSSHHRKRNTKAQAIRFVAEEGARNEYVRCGGSEMDYMVRQAEKPFSALADVDNGAFAPDEEHDAKDLLVHAPASEVLDRWQPGLDNAVQVCVVGAGPAGLALASELGKRGIRVGVVSPDRPFTNTYGVWADEFRSLGFAHTIEHEWDDAVCFFGDRPEEKVHVGRAYAKVGRVAFRQELLKRCRKSNNVVYTPGLVENISPQNENLKLISVKDSAETWFAGMIIVAAGGMGGQKFIQYEQSLWPHVGAQTAYGIECEVESHAFDLDVMHFMDYRNYSMQSKQSNKNGVSVMSVPSFLYAMPLSPKRIFLEETCLAVKEPLAFEVLRERLMHRLKWLGITDYKVLEEEWSYIPIGGPLPASPQAHVAFGVSANMVHPATGYSIARSLGEAAPLAEKISDAILASIRTPLSSSTNHGSLSGGLDSSWVETATQTAWDHLWPNERRRRQAFNTFGMELLAQMELEAIQNFFLTFFRLPDPLWKNFLSSNLSSAELAWFALSVFLYGSNNLRWRLMRHLMSSHGVYLVEEFSTLITDNFQKRSR